MPGRSKRTWQKKLSRLREKNCSNFGLRNTRRDTKRSNNYKVVSRRTWHNGQIAPEPVKLWARTLFGYLILSRPRISWRRLPLGKRILDGNSMKDSNHSLRKLLPVSISFSIGMICSTVGLPANVASFPSKCPLRVQLNISDLFSFHYPKRLEFLGRKCRRMSNSEFQLNRLESLPLRMRRLLRKKRAQTKLSNK